MTRQTDGPMTEPTPAPEPAPLAGVRVVDLTEEVGELCGRLLALLFTDRAVLAGEEDP